MDEFDGKTKTCRKWLHKRKMQREQMQARKKAKRASDKKIPYNILHSR